MSEAYTSVELNCSVPGIGYTLKHRWVVKHLILYFCKNVIGKPNGNGEIFTETDYKVMQGRAKMHDMDKVLMSFIYPQLTADYFHRLLQGHHQESVIEPASKTKYDWIEYIMDCESAKYTKPDKAGGGAFLFLKTYRESAMPYLMPWFQLFGLDKDDSGYVDSIRDNIPAKIYEKDLVDNIIEYIHTTRIHRLDGLARIDDKGFMEMYGKVVPFRHPSVQSPQGLIHTRPNQACTESRSVMKREMINGTIEASLFDFDALNLLEADKLESLNKKALEACAELGAKRMQR